MKRLATALALTLVLATAGTAAAHHHVGVAETQVFAAYGTGNTACLIEVQKYTFAWGEPEARAVVEGHSECNVALEQQMVAAMEGRDGGADELGSPCADVTTQCDSSAAVDAASDWVGRGQIRIKLRAPDGQGWVGSPKDCSGIGTDNLTCTFQAYVAWPWQRDF